MSERVYGAVARAMALAADDPDWMNVTRWPRDTATEWWHCLTCGWLNRHNDPEHDGCGECGKRQEMHP